MDTDGRFELTDDERNHLKALWQQPMTVRVLTKCSAQLVDNLKNQLVTAAIERVPTIQAQILAANGFWVILERTAKDDASGSDKRTGEEVRRYI